MKSKIYTVTVYENGEFRWKLNGKLHREDGPAVKYADGTELYFFKGKIHRKDGPALKHANGTEEYYLNDKCHREDGPAVKYSDGSEEYWLDNKEYSKKDFDKEISKRKQKALACENKEVMIDGVKYKLTKV